VRDPNTFTAGETFLNLMWPLHNGEALFHFSNMQKISLIVGRDKAKPFPACWICTSAGPIGRKADWHAKRPKGTAHGRAV
jgi:hypothetical protein